MLVFCSLLFATVVLSQTPTKTPQVTAVNLPLSTLIPLPILINAPNAPKLCQNNAQFTSCTTSTTNKQAACQSLISDGAQPDIPFYTCVCKAYEDYIKCFDLCTDDPQLSTQKAIYLNIFSAQCSQYNQMLNEDLKRNAEQGRVPSNEKKEKKLPEGPPAVANPTIEISNKSGNNETKPLDVAEYSSSLRSIVGVAFAVVALAFQAI